MKPPAYWIQFTKFALVGTSGFAIDAGVLYSLLQFGFGYFNGRIISFICAVFATWLMNRYFTFTRRSEVSVTAEAARYFAAMLLGGGVNYIAYSVVIIKYSHTDLLPLVAVAGGSVAGLIFNFLIAKIWVFKLKNCQ